MSQKPIKLSFEADNTVNWKARVEKELKGKAYQDYLVWKSLDGFEIEAWQNNLPEPCPQLIPLNDSWKALEPVYETDAQKANEAALAALMVGAEAIWFNKSFQGAASEVSSKNIDQSVAPVFINHQSFTDAYASLLKDSAELKTDYSTPTIFNGKRFRERGANAIQEIAFVLAQAIEIGESKGFDHEMMFKLGYGNEFLLEISKTRALRWLWSSILSNEGLTPANPTIIAANLQHLYAQNDEHSNILRATSAGLSAVLGGAQFVMIESWNKAWKESDVFSKRISRNIHNLMRDESKLDKNLNPADGSYFIEHLTKTIAEKAWTLVQEILADGGFSAYAKSGKLKEAIESSRNQLIEAYKSDKKVLLGVNKYLPAKVKPEQQPQKTHYTLLPDFLFLPTLLIDINK